ncbi:MAG: AAA family ATPase, partial [Deltaproteobacteria bacterium]|nr:AAA family ATPase [Deltaproteobacteria bacterium]
SIQRRAVLYDKEGDAHFDVASAFIKSLRGSDPDAALYWMGRMVYAGEHPRFIFRRMLIFASEDVGLADPQALGVVSAAAQAFDYVGMPEGRYPLSQACLYLATAPKSNSTMAFFDALAVVERERSGDVPNHLKDASRDADGFGHGKGYLYPHAFRDHWVAQQYLPEGLRGRVFYQPGTVGREAQIREQVLRRREASLAAGHAGDAALTEQFPGAELTPGPITSAAGSGHLASADSTWQARGSGTLAAHLEQVRERIFEAAHVKRDSLVLVLNAGDGLLAGEALRISDAAGVWALVASEAEGEALRAQVQLGDALGEPVVRVSPGEPLPERLMGTPSSEAIRFDRILGRGVLGNAPDKAQRLERLAGLLAPGGRLVLAETVPALGERLLASLDWRGLGEGLNTRETDALAQRAQAAEAALYADPDDPQVNWTDTDLARLATAPGLRVESVQVFATPVEFTLSPRLLERWFGPGGRLAARLGDDTPRVRTLLETSLRATRGVLRRRTAVAVLAAVRE